MLLLLLSISMMNPKIPFPLTGLCPNSEGNWSFQCTGREHYLTWEVTDKVGRAANMGTQSHLVETRYTTSAGPVRLLLLETKNVMYP